MSQRSGMTAALLFVSLSAILIATTARTARSQGPESITPAPRTGAWMDMHKKFLETTKKGNVDLLFLGDSITQGWYDNEVWKRHYGPRNAANYGIGGDQTQHVLWRLQNGEVDGISPKLVVLMIGTNNAGRGDSAKDIATGITAVVKTLREKLPKTKILLLGVFPRDPKPTPRREKLAEVNGVISKLDDGSFVKYLDIGKVFLDKDGTLPKELMPDFLHLSLKGYRAWADAIEPTVWEMLDEPKK